VIVESGPNPTKVISAADLTKRFAADRFTMQMTDDAKKMIVEGEIVGKVERGIYLKGDEKLRVACYFSEDQTKTAHRFGNGQRVRAFGKFSAVNSNEHGPGIGCDAIIRCPTN
jgi:hypothetical protein